MNTESTPTDASGEYAAAYAAHYAERDLPLALQLYRSLTASHPGSVEAGYSETQIANIVRGVVPKQELVDAHVELAVAQSEHNSPRDSFSTRDPAFARQRSAHKAVPL